MTGTADRDATGPAVSPSPPSVTAFLCGLAGALVLPAVVALFVGPLVLRRGDRGNPASRRMAKAGIALAIGWLCLDLAVGVWVYRDGASTVANHYRPATVALINDLPQGKFDGTRIRIGPRRAAELAGEVNGLGVCRDVTIGYAAFSHGDEAFGITFYGTAEFENGRRHLSGRMFFDGVNWGYSELDWQ